MSADDISAEAECTDQPVAAIQQCSAYLLLFSSAAERSPGVRKELETAFECRKTIIPYKIEDVPMSDAFRYFLSGIQWIVAQPNDAVFSHLIDAIGTALVEDAQARPAEGTRTGDEAVSFPPPQGRPWSSREPKQRIVCTVVAVWSLVLAVVLVIWLMGRFGRAETTPFTPIDTASESQQSAPASPADTSPVPFPVGPTPSEAAPYVEDLPDFLTQPNWSSPLNLGVPSDFVFLWNVVGAKADDIVVLQWETEHVNGPVIFQAIDLATMTVLWTLPLDGRKLSNQVRRCLPI